MEDKHFYVGPDEDPDKYRLLAQVSRGGEAELWEADMVVAGGRERVAVKILHDDHAADAERWTARWAEQVELLRLINHPGVVGVHTHFKGPRLHRPGAHNPDDRALYMVMNWVDGQDLRDWVPQHTRPEDRHLAMRYLAQVANVLDWLHSGATPSRRPILHCDISPANVIINRDGQAVLVDFGLIRVARHITNVAAGTHGYTAPEVLRGGEYSPASDRYAFGGLAYYVLTGTHPPVDPRQLHAGLATIAGYADHPATVAQLATIFSVNPAVRPTCAAWLRNLRLHSSTAPVRPMPLPPLAPGAPAPVMPRPAPKPGQAAYVKRAAVIAAAFLSAVILTVTLTILVARDTDSASGSTTGGQRNHQGSTDTPATQVTSVPTTQAAPQAQCH